MRAPSPLRSVPGRRALVLAAAAAVTGALVAEPLSGQGRPNRPILHGKHWVAITGKPLAATAGARIFQEGGNAVDAACAMLAATSTMWDVLSWGGETQALVYDPETREVIGVNALGVAPTGATPELYRERGHEDYPPSYGPLAAVTPGTPGGLMTMLAEWGRLSLADVLAPAMEMAREGYPIEASAVRRARGSVDRMREWRYTREVFFTHPDDEENPVPRPGEIFRQPDLARTLEKLVEAEREALDGGASREEAIYAAYDRFYTGDIAEEFVRGAREEGALVTEDDLASWAVHLEEPVTTNYRGYDVYKLTTWVQSPVLLQTLNILENFDVEAMGYNSARYIHALYQAMNLAFADRDFYYGDPYFPPDEPVAGLLSKEYAAERAGTIGWERNDPDVKPGDPYRHQEGENPFLRHLERWPEQFADEEAAGGSARRVGAEEGSALASAVGAGDDRRATVEEHWRGTTSIQAVDADGWVVSITPSGGWIPAVVAGETGVGMSQRAQSFVLDPAENPYNAIEPGKRPRATLTPTIVLEDGAPWVSVAVQGGDTQDQNTLQFLLNMIHFGMDVQEAVEAANITSYQMYSSFGDHEKDAGLLELNEATPPWVRSELRSMGYDLFFDDRTSGPLNAVWFDREHGTFWGAASDYGDDYGIAW